MTLCANPYTPARWSPSPIATCLAVAGVALLWWLPVAHGQPPSLSLYFWPDEGVHSNFVAVEILCPGGMIRYSTDGSDPGRDSQPYLGPIALCADTVIKARAFPYNANLPPSELVSKHYRIHSAHFDAFQSALPVLILRTPSAALSMTHRHRARVTVLKQKPAGAMERSIIEHHGPCEFWVRGSSSRGNPKKSLRLETQDDHGRDQAVSMLGLPAGSDWILFASYSDRTLARDVLAYETWRSMGYYAPRWQFVEVFIIHDPGAAGSLNDPESLLQAPPRMADYMGLYVLLEKIKRDRHRIDIAKLHYGDTEEPYVSGGYIFKRDRLNSGENGFRSLLNIPFAFEEPKEEDIHPLQAQWLSNYVSRFEMALMGDQFTDPHLGYRPYIDPQSFIDYHWMVEVFRNLDGYLLSLFLHKDRNAPLRMGPIWDWDMTLGNTVAQQANRIEGWSWESVAAPMYQWYQRLFEDPDFLQAYIDRYSQLRSGPLATTNLLQAFTHIIEPLAEARSRNEKRWGLNRKLRNGRFIEVDYGARAIQAVTNWLDRRLAWIDGQGFPPPTYRVGASIREGAHVVTLQGPGGQMYYTLDESDPRGPHGTVAAGAHDYQGSLLLEPGTTVRARTRSPYHIWSPPLRFTLPP